MPNLMGGKPDKTQGPDDDLISLFAGDDLNPSNEDTWTILA